jgi:ABC-type nitrate/sulfonate/bicarbonate transport system permease component
MRDWGARLGILGRVERSGPLVLIAAALGTWEALAREGAVSPLFFPAPSVVVAALWGVSIDGEIGAHAAITLARVLIGFGIGGGAGLALGLLMGVSPGVRAQLDPLVAAAHPIPKIAILPLFLIVFGIGEASKIVLAAVGAFFPMTLNTLAGVQQISPVHFEVARSYGAGRVKLFTRVVLPGSLPLVLTGARLALNVALTLTIAGELVASDRGLGQMIWFGWETLRIETVYAGLVAISIVGIGFHLLLGWLGRVIMPWRTESPTGVWSRRRGSVPAQAGGNE